MMLMVENDHVDDFDAVSNEEDESLLFFFHGTTPPCRTGRAATNRCYFFFTRGLA